MIVIKLLSFALLFLFSSLANGDGSSLEGSMKPVNHIVLVGKELDISCSLNRIQEVHGVKVTSEHLHFKAGKISYTNFKIIDDLTVNVTLVNLTRFDSHVNIFCYARVLEQPYDVAQIKIIVAESLVQPKVTECVVHDWAVMVCGWEPATQEPGIKTDTILYYNYLCRDGNFHECPDVKNGVCTLSRYFEGLYCLYLCANNSLEQKCVPIYTVDGMSHVKPAKVTDISVVGKGSRWVELQWDRSHKEKQVMHYVEVEGKEEGDSISRQPVKASDTRVRLEGLRPNVMYDVRIKSIPLVDERLLGDNSNISSSSSRKAPTTFVEVGHFSDVAMTTVKTDPDVPGGNPWVVPGSFFFDEVASPDKKASVHIFFKKVPKRLHNDVMNVTSVIYSSFPLDGRSTRQDAFDAGESVVQLKSHLDRNKDYLVGVEVFNRRGKNPDLQPSAFIIPSLRRAPKSPGYLYAVLINGSIHLRWSEVKGAHNYSVYWCHLMSSTNRCQNKYDMQWSLSLPPNVTEMIIPVTSSGNDLLVGLSTEVFDPEMRSMVSSGVSWVDCTHKDTLGVLGPQHFRLSPQHPPRSLSVEWNHPECSETFHILGYEVVWCKRISENCLVNDTSGDECCRGNSSATIPRSLTSYIIGDLDPNSDYEVKVRSVSFEKSSAFSGSLTHRVLDSGLSKVVVILITVAAILFVIFCPFAVFLVVQKCCRAYKDHFRRLVIDPPPGLDAEYPVYKYDTGNQDLTTEKTTKETNDNEPTPDGDADMPLVGNGSSNHGNSGISQYTSVIQASPLRSSGTAASPLPEFASWPITLQTSLNPPSSPDERVELLLSSTTRDSYHDDQHRHNEDSINFSPPVDRGTSNIYV